MGFHGIITQFPDAAISNISPRTWIINAKIPLTMMALMIFILYSERGVVVNYCGSYLFSAHNNAWLVSGLTLALLPTTSPARSKHFREIVLVFALDDLVMA